MLFNSYSYEILYEQFRWIYLQGDIKLLLVTVNNRLKFEMEIIHDLSCHPISLTCIDSGKYLTMPKLFCFHFLSALLSSDRSSCCVSVQACTLAFSASESSHVSLYKCDYYYYDYCYYYDSVHCRCVSSEVCRFICVCVYHQTPFHFLWEQMLKTNFNNIHYRTVIYRAL